MDTESAVPAAAVIRKLTIERFRGIKSLTWRPQPSVNLILGGGDVCKTTILEAVGLLLHPTNTAVLTDADYFGRNVDAEFVIEAVMSLPESCGVHQQGKMNWPWHWNGAEAVLPALDEGDDAPPKLDPVFRLRVRGTNDQDLVHEILQTDDVVDSFHVGLRRAIGLIRLSGDERNDRDLRLVQGSALDRLLADKGLRARLGQELADADVKGHLSPEAAKKLSDLDQLFAKRSLPTNLDLGVTGGPGLSIGALIGLRADRDKVALPLASWGAGTRRLATLAIGASLQKSEAPIVLVDELERGLEPYRQRTLVAQLLASASQVFVTTHSAATLAASADAAAVWYLDAAGHIGRLPEGKVSTHYGRDPETFLARVPIVAEGLTEDGFCGRVLELALPSSMLDLGIWITPVDGNAHALDLLTALAKGGMTVAGFVDDEGTDSGRWKAVKDRLADLLFQWKTGCTEANVIPLLKDNLEKLIEDPTDEETGERLRSLAERLKLDTSEFAIIAEKAGDGLVSLVIDAATGKVPDWVTDAEQKKRFKKHQGRWFKSRAGGRELANKVLAYGAWEMLEPQLRPFLNAVRAAVKLPALTTIPGE